MTQSPYGIPPPGYRLPDNTHVGTVHLLVSDMPRSFAYYERIIGLKPLVVDSERAVLGSHGEERPLVTLQTREGIMPAPQGAFGLYHFAILLPERAALGRFAADRVVRYPRRNGRPLGERVAVPPGPRWSGH